MPLRGSRQTQPRLQQIEIEMTQDEVPNKSENQAAFVREYLGSNPDASVDQVVEAGVQAGVTLSRASVHQEKWQIRKDPERLETLAASVPKEPRQPKTKLKTKLKKKRKTGEFRLIEFVRPHPTASAADLVDAAALEGLTLTIKQVQRARFSIKMEALSTPKRSEFIRRYALEVPAAKVVADGRAQGIKLFTSHVNEERAAMLAKSKRAAQRAGSPLDTSPGTYQAPVQQREPERQLPLVIASPTQPAMSLAESEALFRAIAFRLGYERVSVILADMLAAAR